MIATKLIVILQIENELVLVTFHLRIIPSYFKFSIVG